MKHTRGFTIIELLVTTVLIAILSSVGFISYRNATAQANDTKRKHDIEQIRAALELYRNEHGYYPPSGACTTTCSYATIATTLTDLQTEGFISALPEDPSDNTNKPYVYQSLNYLTSHHYGYCVATKLDTDPSQTTSCAAYVSGSNTYNYKMTQP